MTLKEYIRTCPEGDEITVWDNDWDMETYFYNQTDDAWDRAMMKLADKLTVIDVRDDGVIVNLYELIERNQPALEESGLFYDADVDAIMEDMDNILAGYVSENWLVKFVNCLA
jgi:hypothetical protein